MAKSSFWDDLGNALTRKAKGLSSKAENLYEIQKIRNKLSAQERMTEKLMMDIGKMIYTRYEHGEAVDGEVGAICEEISQHMLEADHFRDAIAASKGEKFCPACHKAVMREASFCPYCGAACPTAELEEKATDVIEQAEEELKDAADAEVTEAEEVTEAAEETETPEKEVSGRLKKPLRKQRLRKKQIRRKWWKKQKKLQQNLKKKRNKYLRCGRLLREREPVAVFFTGKGNENTWKILAFNMRTVSQDRQKNQWIYGRKNWQI